MSVRNRITALRFLEQQKRDPEFAKRLGVKVKIKNKEGKKENGKI